MEVFTSQHHCQRNKTRTKNFLLSSCPLNKKKKKEVAHESTQTSLSLYNSEYIYQNILNFSDNNLWELRYGEHL